MNGGRARAALSYWRASRRLLRGDHRMRLSSAAADIVLINHALEGTWPRLSAAAVGALVLLRRADAGGAAPTCGGRSRSPGRPPRRPRD